MAEVDQRLLTLSPTWFLLRTGGRTAAENMAVDELLLKSTSTTPVLRFYSWSEPAASFGYFQKYKEIERLTQLRPLVRRPTDGQDHDGGWPTGV